MNYHQWAERQANRNIVELDVIDYPDISVTDEHQMTEQRKQDMHDLYEAVIAAQTMEGGNG